MSAARTLAAVALLLAAMPATAAGDDTAAPAAAASDELPAPPLDRWDTLPRLQYQPDYQPRSLWVDRAKALDGKDDCHLTPDAKGVVQLSVPFVVLLDAKGGVKAAHASMPSCPALATLVEEFAHDLGPKTLLPPEGNLDLWRASHFYAGWQK